MQKEEKKGKRCSQNKLVITGKIRRIHTFEDGTRDIFVFSRSGSKRRPLTLRLRVYQGTPGAELIRLQESVKVAGYRRAYSVKKNNEWKDYHFFVADTIEKNKSKIEQVFGVQGNYDDDASATYFIEGKVVNARKIDNKWLGYTVFVDYDNPQRKPSFVHINVASSQNLPHPEIGDNICAVCTLTSSQKYIRGTRFFYEDMNIVDMSIVERKNERTKKKSVDVAD